MRRCALFLLIALALALLAVGAQAQERGDAAGEPPAAPRISRLSWSGLTIRAEWNPVARATGYDLRWTPEEQRRRHLTVSAERAVDGSPAEVSALWAGRWRIEVRARIGSGPSAVRGEWSRPRIVRVYDAPPRLEVERFDGEYARLNWTGVGASYELEWGERGKAKQFARRDGRSPTLELGPLEGGKTYEFRVRARDGAGRSGYSPTAVFTPTGWRGGRPGAGYVGRIGQIYALWFPQRGAEWYELSWINAADPTETARVRVGTATSGGSRPQVPGQIGRAGGFENGTWNVRVRAGPRGVWSPLYPLTLSNQPERLALELESSRELCTAGTLTEVSWKISGGSAPYALSVENSAVDVSADNARINCGALSEAEAADEDAALAAKRVTATVTDARGVRREAALDVARARALPAPTGITAGAHRTLGGAYWSSPPTASPDLQPVDYMVRWRIAGSGAWAYDAESVRGLPDMRWDWGISDLSEGTQYELAIAALRDQIEQANPEALQWSADMPFATAAPPQNVVAVSTHNTITVTWDAQPGDRVYSLYASGPHGGKGPSRRSANADTHQAVFTGLSPDTEFAIQISVVMTEGQETGTSTVVRTKPAPPNWQPLPSKPKNLRTTATHNSITAEWNAPHDQADGWYLVSLFDAATGQKVGRPVTIDRTSVIFLDLLPNTRYEVEITHLGIVHGRVTRVVTTSASDEAGGVTGEQQQPVYGELPFPFASQIHAIAWPIAQGPGIYMTSDPWIWRGDKVYGRFHAGLDFGAPTGTPVYAAATGTLLLVNPNLDKKHVLYCPDSRPPGQRPPLYQQIEEAGQYTPTRTTGDRTSCHYIVSPLSGRTALIFHGTDGNGPIVTKYSHLSTFAPGLEQRIASSANEAVQVTQGELIGYVGESGQDSETYYDPHLHFEARYLYGAVSDRWYTQDESMVSCNPSPMMDPVQRTDPKGKAVLLAYCGWHTDRRMTTVLDPEEHLPPLPPAATSLLDSRAIELSNVTVKNDGGAPTLDIMLAFSVARPVFYDYHDFEWVPAFEGGLPRTMLSGLARSRPNVIGYRLWPSRGCSLRPAPIEFLTGFNLLESDVSRVTASVDVTASTTCAVAVAGRSDSYRTGVPGVSQRGSVSGFPTHVTPHNAQLKVTSLTDSSGEKEAALTNFDLHFYVFHASLGTSVSLTTQLGTVADLVLELRNSDGFIKATVDEDQDDDHLVWTVNKGGWYVLVVRGGYLSGASTPSTGTYELNYTLTPAQLCDVDTGPVGTATTPDGSSSVRCVPRQPAALTVSNVTDNGATLGWSASSWAKGFEVQLDGEDVESTLGDSARSHPFTGLTPGKAHTLGVKATRDGLESAFATLTLLKPPSSITQGTTAHNSVKYTWTDGNPTGSATGAEVKIGATGTRQTADSTTYHTFNNLSASTLYTFYIRLKNDQGPSAWRTATVTTPAKPAPPPTCGARPRQELSHTETLSPTYAWSVSGNLASYIKTTVTRTQTRTVRGWLGHPTCAWDYNSWGAWVTRTTTEVVRTRTRPAPVVTTEEVGRTTVRQEWWAFGDYPGGRPPDPPGSCYFELYRLDRYSLAEFTTWRTFNTSRGRWELDGSTKRQTGLQSAYVHTWYSTGMRQYCATPEDGVAGASASAAPTAGTLLPGDYVMAWGGEWFSFTIPSDAEVQWGSRTVDEQEAMVFSVAAGAEIAIIPSQIAASPPTSDNATLSAIVASFRTETDPTKLPASAQQQTCAEAPARDDAGALSLDLDAQWCSVVSSGGELSVRYGEDRISLTVPAGRVWLIFAAAQSESTAAAGIWVMERQSKAYVILSPSDGAELERHAPADATGLPALLDAIAASAALSVYPAPDR